MNETIQVVDHLLADVLAKAQAVQEALVLLGAAQDALSSTLKSNLAVYEHTTAALTPAEPAPVAVPNA